MLERAAPESHAEQPAARSGQTKLLTLLNDIALALRATDTVTGALQSVVRRVCEYNRWIVGHVYRRARDGGDDWLPSGIWYPTDPKAFHGFKRKTMRTPLRYDEGLIGRAAQVMSPLWIENVLDDPRYAERLSTEPRIRAAYLLPVSLAESGNTVDSVLEFLSDKTLPPGDDFIEATRTIEVMLGNLIRRRALENRVANAVEIERERISAELHDVVGQQVTGIELLARTVQRDVERGGKVDSIRMNELLDGIGDLRTQIRELSKEISVNSVPPDHLEDRLVQLAEHHQRAYGVRCTCQFDDVVSGLTRAAATHLYRIAREAVHNAVTHAQPDHVTIRIHLDPDSDLVILEIADDGRGTYAARSATDAPGIGIDIMRYRTTLLDGTLTMESDNKTGTVVTCSVPAILHLSDEE